ncbi:thioredoxin domain-containing protein [Lewinella sp. JB7]|uniref:thioredoxin domain-containing protein n=1 Tax=Lewinella sp. JB7 TaxID=2962887 RepID=UPI0020CA12EF|nr:thioredoxin domain-containing protein [Lewinella sp. JB7]MCP9234918.1 thioredoxin domain-containing protein [Lewinella sp. JB7]
MNRLQYETSPYLLQHAGNPVDWYPWGDEALERARREDKPILVSIGYSTCHWCHVMERESFEVEATARVMNEHFVCIKVDREERPDVDQVYMDACQAITGGGGWPLNAFLLPDARPFYAGTYYPPERKYNRPSWTELLLHFAKLFREDRGSLEEQASNLIQNISSGGDRLLGIEREDGGGVTAMMENLRKNYDGARGGFGGAPKFPMSQALELLLANGILSGNNNDVYQAGHAMRAMLAGGIYDQIGGGFSRYTVDAHWRVPHFEKMLYDNALLLRLLGKLQLVTPDPRYLQAIEETTDWLEREMSLSDGGYRAALDADSEGVEGKYYVWQYDELRSLLPPEDAELVADFYGITPAGNWEEERTNIPYRPGPLPVVTDLPVDVATAKIANARRILADARRMRIPPGADDKLILQWNALLVSGWTWCYRATRDDRYLTLATALYRSLGEQLHNEGRWYRNRTSGKLGAPAFLDDYAALATAALDLSEVTFELDYALRDARALVDLVLDNFSDDADRMFYLRPPTESELPVVTKDYYDNALPSGNSQMAHNLYRLGRLTGEERYERRAAKMIGDMAGAIERYPTSFAGWGLTALLLNTDTRELVITGSGARDAAREFLSDYRPGLLIVASGAPREDLPLLANRYLTELRYFVCENQTCRVPVDNSDAARQLLN